MRKLDSNTIGIDQGDVVLFSDFEHDGQMWTGDGPRNTRLAVKFAEKYRDAAERLCLDLDAGCVQ